MSAQAIRKPMNPQNVTNATVISCPILQRYSYGDQRVFAPAVSDSVFGNDRSELRIGEYIHPRHRRHPCGGRRNDVFASIRRKATDAIGENKIAAAGFESRLSMAPIPHMRRTPSSLRRAAV